MGEEIGNQKVLHLPNKTDCEEDAEMTIRHGRLCIPVAAAYKHTTTYRVFITIESQRTKQFL
jgi:hypothetical protein